MCAGELFFTPKYLKAKEMADQGAFGKIHLVKQSEKHFGPHSEWFWDVERFGGGVLMDMGRHGRLVLVVPRKAANPNDLRAPGYLRSRRQGCSSLSACRLAQAHRRLAAPKTSPLIW
jgi:hypothetical protein